MYLPAAFAETDTAKLHEFMRRYSFAILTSQGEGGLVASHLPLLLDADVGPHGHLLGHMARASPQWRQVDGEVTAVFSGPHAYVSPYGTRRKAPSRPGTTSPSTLRGHPRVSSKLLVSCHGPRHSITEGRSMPEQEVYQCRCPGCLGPGPHPDRGLHQQINLLLSRLDEQQRGWYAAVESAKLGHGGGPARLPHHRAARRHHPAGAGGTGGIARRSPRRPGPAPRRGPPRPRKKVPLIIPALLSIVGPQTGGDQ